MKRLLSTSILALCCLVVISDLATACPTCKEALAGGNSANLINGFGWSILFMMATPFVILGGLSAYFYYEIRKARMSSSHAVATNATHMTAT